MPDDNRADTLAPLPSEQYVPRAMPAVLGQADMTITFVMALFLLINAVSGAAGGPVSLLYLGLGALVFFLPCVVATTQLGVMFPNEGSLLNWTTKAINRFWGFFVGICFWLTGVLAVLTAGSALVTTLQGMNNSVLNTPWQQGLMIIGVVIFVGILGLQPMRLQQNLINSIFVLTMIAVFLIGLSAIIWLVAGHPSATNFADPSGWSMNSGNFFLFAIITLNFIGASGPLNMAGEIRGRGTPEITRIIKRHLLWGTVIVIALYTIVTVSVLIVRGAAITTAIILPFEGFSTVSIVLGRPFGDIASFCFLCYCVAAVLFYTYASARLLMVAAMDQRLPMMFGRLNKNRIPSFAILFQVGSAVFVAAIIFILFPFVDSFGGNSANTVSELYNVVAASCTLLWTIATTFFFINLIFFYHQNPRAFRHLRQFPMWVIWLSILIGSAACLLTIVGILAYAWIPLISNNTWWYIVGGVTLALLIIAILGSMFASSQASFETLAGSE